MAGMNKVLKSELVYEGAFLRVQKDTVELLNQGLATREYVLHPGAALVICQDQQKQILLIRQYRHALRQEFVEFPAGKRDAGEDLRQTAERELREETGIKAKHLQRIGSIHPCIGYADELIEVYFTDSFSVGTPQLQEGEEELQSFWVSEKQFIEKLNRGEITDGKTLAAWSLWRAIS